MAWGAIFWTLRRRGGPVLFVERQIAHVWAAAVVASIGVFVVEMLLGRMPVLTLSPILAVIAGMVFVVKAGMLSGAFYLAAAALFLTAVPMALFPRGRRRCCSGWCRRCASSCRGWSTTAVVCARGARIDRRLRLEGFLVPTLCVGTHAPTLCVASVARETLRRNRRDAERRGLRSHAERGNEEVPP